MSGTGPKISVEPGRGYRHRKGGRYTVLVLAEHSETGEDLVVYRRDTDEKVYARPRAMFEDGRFQPTPRGVRERPTGADLVPLIRRDAEMVSLAEGVAAGMVPLEPPGGSTPAGFEPTESLEWGVTWDRMPQLLEHFDVTLTVRDGRVCGYLTGRGATPP